MNSENNRYSNLRSTLRASTRAQPQTIQRHGDYTPNELRSAFGGMPPQPSDPQSQFSQTNSSFSQMASHFHQASSGATVSPVMSTKQTNSQVGYGNIEPFTSAFHHHNSSSSGNPTSNPISSLEMTKSARSEPNADVQPRDLNFNLSSVAHNESIPLYYPQDNTVNAVQYSNPQSHLVCSYATITTQGGKVLLYQPDHADMNSRQHEVHRSNYPLINIPRGVQNGGIPGTCGLTPTSSSNTRSNPGSSITQSSPRTPTNLTTASSYQTPAVNSASSNYPGATSHVLHVPAAAQPTMPTIRQQEDKILKNARQAPNKLTYKQIGQLIHNRLGVPTPNENTLRGRWRALAKDAALRPRRPQWSDRKVSCYTYFPTPQAIRKLTKYVGSMLDRVRGREVIPHIRQSRHGEETDEGRLERGIEAYPREGRLRVRLQHVQEAVQGFEELALD